MFNAETIEIASRNEGAKNVDHHYYMVNARDKYNALRRICDINPEIYGIVFCRTRRETAAVADKLVQDGYNADAIHGELSQTQRDYVMAKFRKKKIQILVATDVAARGIDINELTHVINYNLPDDNEVYVHRSGRTGRAGKKGISIIIAHSREGRKLKDIEKMIKRDLTLKQIPNGDEVCQIQLMNLIDKVIAADVNHEIQNYLESIEEKLDHLNKQELIKKFVSIEFNRFLSFYKNAPNLNVSLNKEKKRNNRNEKRKKRGEKTGHAEPGHTRFFINLGKEKKLQTHNLIGLINEYTKNRNMPIGKIDIMRKFSFFEVPSDFETDILSSLNNANCNNEKVNVEISQIPGAKSSNNYRKKRKIKNEKGNAFSLKRKEKKKKSRRKNQSESSSNIKIAKLEKKSFKSRFNATARRRKN